MTNPLQLNYFVRRAWCVVGVTAALGCGGKKSEQNPSPQTTAPLPTAGIAGQRVALTPLALVGAEDTLHLGFTVSDAAVAAIDDFEGTNDTTRRTERRAHDRTM